MLDHSVRHDEIGQKLRVISATFSTLGCANCCTSRSMQRGVHATIGVATAAGGAYVASGTGFPLDVSLGLEASIPAQCDAAKSEGGRAMPHFPSRKFTTRKQQV